MKKNYFHISILVFLVLLMSGCPKEHTTGTSLADRQLFMNTLSSSGFDLDIIDYSQNGDDGSAYQRGELDLLRARGNCLIAACLSLGVAETNRFYWHNEWDANGDGIPDAGAPSWLVQRVATHRPNYPDRWLVHYWDPEWKRIIFGRDSSYLSRILQAGFNGVYLTGIESYTQVTGSPNPDSTMRAFLIEFADSAKARQHGFFVIGQNMGTITRFGDVVTALDGAAQDGMFYGYGIDGTPTPLTINNNYYSSLSAFGNAGKPMFAIDYPYSSSPDQVYYASPALDYITDGHNRSVAEHLLYYPAPRNLDDLSIVPGLEPVTNVSPVLLLNQVNEFCLYLRPGPK